MGNRQSMELMFHLLLTLWSAMVLTGCSGQNAAPSTPVVTLNPSRDYGYVLGDLIPLSINIRLAEGDSLDQDSLPPIGPLNDWLNLRGTQVESVSEGNHEITQLRLVYQIFKGVRIPEAVTLPPISLRTRGQSSQTFETPSWTFTLTPVIPPEITDDDVQIQPDSSVEPASTIDSVRTLTLWLSATGLTLLLLTLGEWRRRRHSRPFATTSKEMNALLARDRGADALRKSARMFHRALDQTLGETLFAGEIERYCSLHANFAPLQDRLADFFALSQRLFFDPNAGEFEAETREWLKDLAKRCARAENRSL